MANQVLNAVERNLRAFRHVSSEIEPVEKELGSTWYVPSEDVTYKWVDDGGVFSWELISGKKTKVGTLDPTVNDDDTRDFDVGSRWINSTTGCVFHSVDNTTGSAVWVRHIDVEGDTMIGSLALAGDPIAPLEAATKQYVDATSGTGFTQEEIEDIVGAMTAGSHDGIVVVYDDTAGTILFNVNDPILSVSGAVTGSATMTNLGNTDIVTSIATLNVIGDVNYATIPNAGEVLVHNGVQWTNTNSIDGGGF